MSIDGDLHAPHDNNQQKVLLLLPRHRWPQWKEGHRTAGPTVQWLRTCRGRRLVLDRNISCHHHRHRQTQYYYNKRQKRETIITRMADITSMDTCEQFAP